MALIIQLKVVPQSGKHTLCLDKSGILKCFVKAAAQDGKANKEVIEVVSNVLNLPKKSIEIVSGLTSRAKKLAIQTDLTYEQFLMKIGCTVQKKMF